MKRNLIPMMVSRIVENRPVSWASLPGEYDGRERTLRVFNADPVDQLRLMMAIKKQSKAIETALDGPLLIIFHSVTQTSERYAEIARSFPKQVAIPRRDIAPPPDHCEDLPSDDGPHRRAA